jgi:hypothetical protein
MSLTSHLKSPDSPVRVYLEEAVPILEQSKRGRPLARELSSFLKFDKLPPCRLPTLAPKSNQGTIGTAVDYRLRYCFRPFDSHETAAGKAVKMLRGGLGTLGRKFLDYQNELVARLKPAEHQLDDHDEATLDANCVILAFFEQERWLAWSRHRFGIYKWSLRRLGSSGADTGVRAGRAKPDRSKASAAKFMPPRAAASGGSKTAPESARQGLNAAAFYYRR